MLLLLLLHCYNIYIYLYCLGKNHQTSIVFQWGGFGESQIDFSSEGPAEITNIRSDTISNPSLYTIIYPTHLHPFAKHLLLQYTLYNSLPIFVPFSERNRPLKPPRQRRWCSSTVRRPVPTSMRPSCGASRAIDWKIVRHGSNQKNTGEMDGQITLWYLLVNIQKAIEHGNL